jgi:pimeloyl-ACP methyl ester carboxylesterase
MGRSVRPEVLGRVTPTFPAGFVIRRLPLRLETPTKHAAASIVGVDGVTQLRPGPATVADVPLEVRTVHGYRRAYRVAGAGPAVLLLHGIGDSSQTWLELIPRLARDHTVIAPDLLGHGASDKPRADYAVAAYANGMRDLLGVLGVDRVTVVGHSLGGGVAMQFAYQFPERTERLVLVGAGGVGREVNPLLRLLTLPGAELSLTALRLPGVRRQLGLLARLAELTDTGLGEDVRDLLRVADSLDDATARRAFGRTLRAVVDWRGQVVTMLDRCYLAQGMPTLLVWGGRDPVVPVRHALRAHQAMPGSRLVVFPEAGHFPFHSDPRRFEQVLRHFLRSTSPATWSAQRWREVIRSGGDPVASSSVDQRSAT